MSGWPELAAVQAVLLGAGVQVRDPAALSPYLALAQAEWERETGYRPFFAAPADWLLDAPDDGLLTLPNGLLSVDTVAYASSSTSDGSVATLGTGYLTQPDSALSLGLPVERLIVAPGPARHRSVRVRGVQGRMQPDSEDAETVRYAVALLAASLALPAMMGTDGPVKKVTQGPVTIESDTASGATRGVQWRDAAMSVAALHRRLVL